MSKRIVCVLLALIMLVGLVPAGIITASAASNLTVSENAIKFIKEWEGYSKNAYWDNSQYSYGYGTVAPNGLATITEADADKALREELKTIDAKVNGFAATHGKNFSQQQHDALVSFTYNCGWGWMSQPSYRITKAVINGSVGNEFLQAMALWSNVDSIPQAGLVSRRMAEADMYLTGSYTKSARSSYTYVTFDANGGVLGEDKVQAYDYTQPVSITSVPTREGFSFLGWYTKAEEGVPVTVLDSTTSKVVLYAHWQNDDSVIEDNKTVIGTPASYSILGSQLASLNVYSVPNSNNAAIGSVSASETLKVTAEYVDENSIKWVKISSGWVTLGDVKTPIIVVTGNTTVTVTNAYINIRKEPNTNATNAPIGTVKYGDKLVITEVREVKGSLWGKFEKGWVALMYTDYNSASSNNTTTESGAAIAEGTVTVTNTNLNVRTGAGTDKALVGTLTNGTKVTIYEITTVGGHSWGRIGTSRWVCLDYVVYKDIVSSETTGSTNNGNVTQTVATPYMFTATVSADGLYVYDKAGDTGVMPVGSLNKNASVYIVEIQAVNSKMFGKVQLSNAVGWIQLSQTTYTAYGKVDTAMGGALNVREGAGSSYSIVQKDGKDLQLENGSAVTILELKANGTGIWARVKEGWISMDHVALNTSTPTVSTTPSTGTSNGDGSTVIMTGVVNSGINLNVRLGAGVGFDIVNSLPNGTQVKIYEKQLVNGHYWGKMGNNAWICLSYITDTTSQTGLGDNTTTGGTTDSGASNGTTQLKGVGATVYNCTSGVNIRTAPGTNSALAGSAPVGSRVTVYEQQSYNGALWARTDEGWISMLYLKLDTDPSYSNPGSSVSINGLFAASVLVNELPVYDAVNGGTAVATLVKGNVVYVTELQSYDGTTLSGKVTVNGKTGWIDLSNTAYTASGVVATKEGGTLNVRSDAKADASVVEKLNNGSAITIVALKPVKSGANTTIWGKIAEGKWVAMEHVNIVTTTVTAPSTGTSNTSTTSVGVIYNAGSVNVRSAAGVKNPQVAVLMQGTQVIVHEETVVDDAQWVRISTETVNGWVAKKYVSISYTMNNGGNGTSTGTGTGTGTETVAPSAGSNYATGYVNSNIPLNVRSLPDVNSPKVGELTKGMTITIYEQQAGGGLTWGRVDNGWVALNYVTITSTGSTGNGNMGTIIKAFSKVNVRSMPGTGNAIVGEVMVNSRVEILDQQMYNGAVWYRISNGWVAGEYVELDAPFVPGGTTEQAPGGSITGDNMTNTDTGANDEVGGQYTTAVLKHPSNDVVKFYTDLTMSTVATTKINGTTVVITALKGVGTEVWANTSFGWFNLTDESTNFIAVGTVNTISGGQLNVRSTAGITSDTPVAKLDNKSSITITSVKVANGQVWGKMAKGWVSLEHLALTAAYQGVQGATGGTNVAEVPASVSGKLFNATIKAQHLTINVYDKADGKVVGFVEAGNTIRVNQIVATMSGIWGKTATDAGERWIKLSDVDYTIDDTIAVDCTGYSSAGGTATVGTFKKGDAVNATNLIAVGDEIYAQIKSNNSWVNIKELSKWYVAPATKDVESVATVASDVLFSSKVSVGGAYFYKDASTTTSTGSMSKDTVVLVKDVKVSYGEVWAEIHVFVTAPDMSVTATTRWTKLSYLSGGYTVAASANTDVYMLKGTSYASYGSDPYKTVLKGESVTITSFVMAGDGTLWAKVAYSVDGVAVDAYIQAQYLTY